VVDVIFGYDFFVSYTWADGSKYAHSLYEKLKAQGFTVFLDEEDYTTGDNWTLLGRRALKKTHQLILVGTPRVHESGPVLKELTAFQSTGRRIIPIEIGDSLNPQKYPKSPLLSLLRAELLKINQPLQQDGAILDEDARSQFDEKLPGLPPAWAWASTRHRMCSLGGGFVGISEVVCRLHRHATFSIRLLPLRSGVALVAFPVQ